MFRTKYFNKKKNFNQKSNQVLTLIILMKIFEIKFIKKNHLPEKFNGTKKIIFKKKLLLKN